MTTYLNPQGQGSPLKQTHTLEVSQVSSDFNHPHAFELQPYVIVGENYGVFPATSALEHCQKRDLSSTLMYPSGAVQASKNCYDRLCFIL